MSNMEHFDHHFRESLSGYSPPLPDGAWEKLLAERERRRPKAIAWYASRRNLMVAAAAAVLCSTGAYWFIAAKTNTSSHKHSPAKTATLTTPKSVIQPQNITSDEAGHKGALTHIEAPENKNDDTQKEKTSAFGQDSIANNANSHASVIQKRKPKTAVQKNYRAAITSSTTTLPEEDWVAATHKAQPGGYSQDENVFVMQKQFFEAEKISAAVLKSPQTIKPGADGITPCPQIEKEAAGNKSYFEFYAGPDYAMRRYDNSINNELSERRKEALSFHSAFSAGLRYTRVFNNGVSVRTGINYSRINEKFSFVQSNIVQTVYIIDAASGDTTGSYTVTGKRYRTTYNNYHTVDIPVLFGYEMGNGRLHANINAGIMVNLRSWQRGETLDTAYRPVSFTSGSGDKAYQYKTNIGLGFSAATSLYYRLTDNLRLLAEPYIRYNLSPMNKNETHIQERFTTIGMRLGLRFDLD
ncbi:MAG TPA: outer membrane beta-barrel protein [Ferruginibacter sp.]|nr:outer membrane beta-barrel protein [Ferruginibacter sp.]HMP19735.1 outer membrane beta-barrel protein [Ferruginibacter sp.]